MEGLKKIIYRKICKFDYLLIDPHKDNLAAIKAYQKCGFKEVARDEAIEEIWMMR